MPAALRKLIRSDPAARQGRYQDICGADMARIMDRLDWHFAADAVSQSLCKGDGQVIAVAFAAPIRLHSNKTTTFDGINLSYAVHSTHEGQGWGLASSCMALMEADLRWGSKLKKCFLNIQTRLDNKASLHLLERLAGNLVSEAAFTVPASDGLPIEFVGTRAPWKQALAQAEIHLLGMDFLAEHEPLALESDFPAPNP